MLYAIYHLEFFLDVDTQRIEEDYGFANSNRKCDNELNLFEFILNLFLTQDTAKCFVI